MGIISTLICLLLLMICLKSSKDGMKNPFALYFALWFMILFFSSLHMYGMYIPSNKTYMLITVMNVFFFFGGLIKLPRKVVAGGRAESATLNKPVVYFLIALSLSFKTLEFITALDKLRNGMELWQIRQDAFEVYDMGSGGLILELIKNAVISPFTTVSVPLTTYLIFREPSQKITKMLVVYLVVSNLMEAVSAGGGRLMYIYIAGCLIYSFLFLDKQKIKGIYEKYEMKMKMIFSLLVMVVVMFTILRSGWESIFRQVYTYFGMTPTLLDVNLSELKGAQHTFGMLTFFGIHSYFFRFLNIIGMEMCVPELYETAYQYILNANLFKDVGFGIANSFVSPIYFFYLDGGIAFVALMSTLFGAIVSNSMKNIINNMDERKFCYYCIMMYAIFLTFIQIQTAIPAFMISILFVPLVLKREKLKRV